MEVSGRIPVALSVNYVVYFIDCLAVVYLSSRKETET